MVEAVEETLDTPCVRNPRSLLVCALAAELEGEHTRARALEARAEELGMEERGSVFEGPRFGLALARGDRESIARLAARPGRKRISTWFGLSADAKRLDGLASIGDRDAVEAEAPRHLKPSRPPTSSRSPSAHSASSVRTRS